MNTSNTLSARLRALTRHVAENHGVQRVVGASRTLAIGSALGFTLSAGATTPLADQPPFSSSSAVPGNLALALSVEFPTAVSVAHIDTGYSPNKRFVGYFDQNKCYTYQYDATNADQRNSYFVPAGMVSVPEDDPNNPGAATRTCTGGKWSGSFLNWASMQTIDPFRWALTGGYRVIDLPGETVLEKAWASGQGGTNNFPNRTLGTAALVAGATPMTASAARMRIQGLGNKMRFTGNSNALAGSYYPNTTFAGVGAIRSDSVDFSWPGRPIDPAPANSFPVDNFSVRWAGNPVAPVTGNYKFQVRSDGGARLYVNGALVINRATKGATADTNTVVDVALTAGTAYTVLLEYFDDAGTAEVRLRWQPPGAPGFTTFGTDLVEQAALVQPYTGGAMDPAAVYEMFMRVRVCDASSSAGGLEKNCVAYPSGYAKPEGLIQQYAMQLRLSAFGYLNDGTVIKVLNPDGSTKSEAGARDAGVLRAAMKFVGPQEPIPGAAPAINAATEWDPLTGVFPPNPDSQDALDTTAATGVPVSNSGVINYLNKFGSITKGTSSYKRYDPVNEMYYAAVRYFKNQGDVPAWSSVSAGTAAERATWVDGFPVITNWKDPIKYYCQKNFILGIGDVNTHADRNLPTSSVRPNEPAMPAEVLADLTTVEKATNKVGVLEGMGAALGTTVSGNNSGVLMAGVAYEAHTRDIRPDLKNVGDRFQSISTYWLDVLEGSKYQDNNKYYLATKYGGFDVPAGFDTYNRVAPLEKFRWSNSGAKNGVNDKPDNYFVAAKPEEMVAGLTKAFGDIAQALAPFTTSFSTSLPQVSLSGNASFGAEFDSDDWSGEIRAKQLDFDPTTGAPTQTEVWTATKKLETQLAGTGWNTARRVASWDGTKGVPFRSTGLTAAQMALLDTTYRAADDRNDYLNYLRGDRTYEVGSTAAVPATDKVYRTRSDPDDGRIKLLGDIIGSRANPVPPPSFPLSDGSNPGYSDFQSTWKNRPTVLYVGANDGLLHAFNGALTGADAGKEIFAYVPSAVLAGPDGTPGVSGLAALGNTGYVHRNFVNATPQAYDVDFDRTGGNIGGSGTPDWRSILIGGLGKGGRSYYAIDITNPEGMTSETAVANNVLWEISSTKPDGTPNPDFAELGFTFGEPAVVKTRKYGWTVIFASGYNNSDGQGWVFFVDPKTGKLLEKVSTNTGLDSIDDGLAHVNAYVLDYSDGYADAVYGGDLLGNLWRVDITGADKLVPYQQTATTSPKNPLLMAELRDSAGKAQPVTSRVVAELHPKTRLRYVMFGTGRLLAESDITSKNLQNFYTFIDGNSVRFNAETDLPQSPKIFKYPLQRADLIENINPTLGITADPNAPMGSYVELGIDTTSQIAWRQISDAATFFGTVAFAPMLPNIDDACQPTGKSRVYAIDYATGLSRIVEGTVVKPYSTDLGGVVTDVRFLSVDGKARLIGGSDTGEVKRVPGEFGSSLTLQRLNWRELPTVD